MCGRGWNDHKTFQSHKELYCGKATDIEKTTQKIGRSTRGSDSQDKLPTMVSASGITGLSPIVTGVPGMQNGNTGILPIFKMLIDKLNELEPGQQQELKSLLKVKTETNNSI